LIALTPHPTERSRHGSDRPASTRTAHQSGCSAIAYQRAKPHAINRFERVDIDSRRAEGLDTRRAQMRSCESSEAGELSRGRMQDAGALRHAHLLRPCRECKSRFRRWPRPRHPRRRSSTTGLDPRPRRAPSEPELGRWVFAAGSSVEASRPAISGTLARARPLWSQRTKQKPTCSFTLR
jgi:hypothetical protein